MAKKSSGPIAPGSKEIPVGSPNCLAVNTFILFLIWFKFKFMHFLGIIFCVYR